MVFVVKGKFWKIRVRKKRNTIRSSRRTVWLLLLKFVQCITQICQPGSICESDTLRHSYPAKFIYHRLTCSLSSHGLLECMRLFILRLTDCCWWLLLRTIRSTSRYEGYQKRYLNSILTNTIMCHTNCPSVISIVILKKKKKSYAAKWMRLQHNFIN